MVEQGERCNEDFHFSRRDICVGSLTFDHSTLNLNHVLTREGFSLLEDSFISAFFVKNKLSDAIAVA